MRYTSLILFTLIVYSSFAEVSSTENLNQKTKISVEKHKNLSEKAKISTKTQDNSPEKMKISTKQEVNLEKKSEGKKENADKDEVSNNALKIIQHLVINCPLDRSLSQNEVFAELRTVFSEQEFSSEELMILIEDAMEIKKKYLLIFEFVVRGEYARRTIREGINVDKALLIASSEYIQLPKFILRKNVDNAKLDDVLSDLGCGIVWKDRAKFSFVLRKYFGKEDLKINEKAYSSRRVRNYLKLIERIDKFFEKSYSHLIYLIAQDFYYAEVSQEKIQKIFSFSDEELKSLIKPRNYR